MPQLFFCKTPQLFLNSADNKNGSFIVKRTVMAKVEKARTAQVAPVSEPLIPAPPAAAPIAGLQVEPAFSVSHVIQAPWQVSSLWGGANGKYPFSTTIRQAQEWGTIKTAAAPWLQADASLEGDQVLLVTHAARQNYYGEDWDDGEVIRSNLNEHVARANQSGIPVIYLVDTDQAGKLEHYYARYRPDYLYYSPGGAHELRFNMKQIVVAGGAFNLCAAETVRDAIFFAERRKEPLRVVFLTDALYTLQRSTLFSPFVVLLKEKIENFSDGQFLAYLAQDFFWTAAPGDYGELGMQNSARTETTVSFVSFTFKIYREGRFVGELGHGPRIVEMDFQ